MKTKRKNEKGQALVENILVIPIIVVIIVMIFWYARILITKQQLLMASRYGTDLIVNTNMNAAQIRDEIREYLSGKDNEGRLLDRKLLKDENIQVNISRLGKISAFNANMYKTYILTPSSVDIYYEFITPGLFSAWAKYIGGDKILKKMRIGARSEVIAGTGCKGDNY